MNQGWNTNTNVIQVRKIHKKWRGIAEVTSWWTYSCPSRSRYQLKFVRSHKLMMIPDAQLLLSLWVGRELCVFVPHDLLIIFFKIPKYLKNFYSQTVAWETTSSTCPEEPAVPMRPVQVVAAVQDMPNLPGTVADDGIDHRPSLPNTHFDQCKNSPVGGMLTSSPQLRRGVSSTKSS